MAIKAAQSRFNSWYLSGIFFLVIITAALYLAARRNPIVLEENEEHEEETQKEVQGPVNGTAQRCNLFSGRWVYDNISSPLYKEAQCSFMMEDYACEKYGRKDLKYQEWRWQPHDCDLPRFNATEFMEKIRGKKVLFVGDSLNRNQYTSLLCLIESSLSSSSNKTVIRDGNLFLLQAEEYNASIGFYWSPFLVESNNDDPYIHRLRNRVVRIKAIENHARHWTDADILIFDSFMWWLEPTMTILWGSFGSTDAVYKQVETSAQMRYRLYEMGLNTWSDWLEFNINRTKTKLFFMSLSPYHLQGETWDEKQNCFNETEPTFKASYSGVATDRKIMRIAESAIQKMGAGGLKIQYLDITGMSDYRKDGHPSIYRMFFHSISDEQLNDPTSYADCIHWCLPGVPDVWNQLLYAYIMHS